MHVAFYENDEYLYLIVN